MLIQNISVGGKQIGAVMVLFNPNWSITSRAIDALSRQTDFLCIVDNTPDIDNSHHIVEYSNINYIPLKKNIGIAAAQNIGIQFLIDKGFDYVLFSDQDSIVPKDTVIKLYNATRSLILNNYKVAAVGTRPINRQTGKPYPPKSLEFKHFYSNDQNGDTDAITECYSVISSVSLLPMQSLLATGGFDESLFIDGVDHEWCWRAWHTHQLRSFIVEKATIEHMLGEGDKSFLGKEISISSPFRVYYQYRNFIWLYKRKTTPKFWKDKHLKNYIIKFFYFPIFVKPRMSYLKNAMNGIKDGLISNFKGSWPSFQQKKG